MPHVGRRVGMLVGFASLLLWMVSTTPVAAEPYVYVTNYGGGSVSVIVPDPNVPTTTDVVATIPVGRSPVGVVLNGAGTRGYVANNNSASVSAFDATKNAPIGGQIPVGYGPHGIAVSPTLPRVYVTNMGADSVSVIDTELDRNVPIGNPIPVGHQPTAIVITPAGTKAYVSNWGSATVSVIDTVQKARIDPPIQVGQAPHSLVINRDGSRVYVTNYGSRSVSVINTVTDRPDGDAISVGSLPVGIAIHPDGSKLYVANNGDNTVSVVSTATRKPVVNPIPVGAGPHRLAIHPTGRWVYVANLAADTVTIIDTQENKVVKSLKVGDAPYEVTAGQMNMIPPVPTTPVNQTPGGNERQEPVQPGPWALQLRMIPRTASWDAPTQSSLDCERHRSQEYLAAESIDRTKPTIVITHGWNRDSDFWLWKLGKVGSPKILIPDVYGYVPVDGMVRTLCHRFVKHGYHKTHNILWWNWHEQATGGWVTDPAKEAPPQGVALADALLLVLGTSYSERIHFIGHSLGTQVNKTAVEELVKKWDPTETSKIHVTLLDAPELGSTHIVAPIPSQAQANTDQGMWVDNYVTAFGDFHRDVPTVLIREHIGIYPDPFTMADDHSYAYKWYACSIAAPGEDPDPTSIPDTIDPDKNTKITCGPAPVSNLMGHQWSAEAGRLTGRPLAGISFATTVPTTDSPLDLYVSDDADAVVILALRSVTLAEMYLDLQSLVVSGITQTIETVGDALVGVEQKLADVAVMPMPVFYLGEGSDAYMWVPITIPANATHMSFDFVFPEKGDGDFLSVGVQDEQVFAFAGNRFPGVALLSSGPLDVTKWAGQNVELFLGLVTTGDRNAQVVVKEVRFSRITPPDPGPPPNTPANLSATRTAGGTTLAWTDTASNEMGFRVERKGGTDGAYEPLVSVAADATGYVDGTAAVEPTYCYRVKAYGFGGDSAYSNESCVSGVQTLTVTKSGTGAGTVTSEPTGINCGTTCSAAFATTASVTLTAVADPGTAFFGWTGAGCTGTGTCAVAMSVARQVDAAFTRNADTDGDGVADNQDKCPNTPPGQTVDATGCSKLHVAISIRPWSELNLVFRQSPLSIPVAILSSPTFDAWTGVNKRSLTFGHTGDEKSLQICSPIPLDVNHDGRKDLVCLFEVRAAGFQNGDSVGILKGKTASGVGLEGTDAIKVVGR